jgi:hypothetical protein
MQHPQLEHFLAMIKSCHEAHNYMTKAHVLISKPISNKVCRTHEKTRKMLYEKNLSIRCIHIGAMCSYLSL